MKILLFGKEGGLGWELQRSLAHLGELVALDQHGQGMCGDFTRIEGIEETVRSLAPDVIVNAAAYTAVDRAESESALCRTINARAPAVLAQEAKRCGALLVHYSTDYVFDGCGERAWQEIDPTGPINYYGKTKLEADQAIGASGCRHLIFRTGWVYSVRGRNFAKTILRLAQERRDLAVVEDHIGAPTGAELLADVTAHALRIVSHRDAALGLYHLAASGETSWYGYARFVVEFAREAGMHLRLTPESIKPVLASTCAQVAARPRNSRLDTQKLRDAFGLTLPPWQGGVARMLTEILETQP